MGIKEFSGKTFPPKGLQINSLAPATLAIGEFPLGHRKCAIENSDGTLKEHWVWQLFPSLQNQSGHSTRSSKMCIGNLQWPN